MDTSDSSTSLSFLVGTGVDKIYYVKNVNGEYKIVSQYKTGSGTTWLQLSNDKKILYANNEDERAIESFALVRDEQQLTLKRINRISSTGDQPCHLQITSDNKFLGVTNYGSKFGGNLGVFAINEDGSLSDSPVKNYPLRDGSSIRADRQQQSHPHQFYIHPNFQQNLYVPDLGLDQILFFKIKEDGQLEEGQSTKVTPGSGPRHIVAHPSDPSILYGSNELTGTLTRYRMTQDGSLELLESYPFHPTIEFGISDRSSAIIVSKAGYVYLAVRGPDLVSVYKINSDSQLTYIKSYGGQGELPRFITLTPDESQLMVLYQDSNLLAFFDIEGETLIYKETIKDIESPQAIVFL